MRVLAVIPARGGSKRLPGKNTRQLFDKPLIAWSIEFAKSIPSFTDIQVSTDSAEIAAVCSSHGIEVPRLRPVELATDEATSIEVVLDVLSWKRANGQEFDAVALLQPTTPIRFAQRWVAAFDLLNSDDCEGVIGVSLADTHPYLTFKNSADGFLEPWLTNPSGVTRSQDYPPAYAVNGALYLIRVGSLVEQRTFFPKKCRLVLCSERVENIDVDTPFDWRVAEMLIADWMAEQ
ncbi:MAG: acylneuraminate cytidylyltransferase family protein [Gammaproteobacteria bacterium]